MDPALQLIMDQFKELKSDISDMIEDKVGNWMSTIAKGLKTDLNGLQNEVRALVSMVNEGKAEMEGRLEGHQNEVTTIVEQQTRHLWEDIEATRRELEARLAAVDARSGRVGGAVIQGPTPLQ
jgi:chaperonin cofactor prefoldin